MIVFLCLIIICICQHHPFFANAKIECEIKNDNNYDRVEIFNNTDCYFVVKGAINKVNQKVDNTTYELNFNAAREICKEENATLPIIKSEAENQFLTELFQTIERTKVWAIALGLQKFNTTNESVEYKWDDGSNITYKPFEIDWDFAEFAVLVMASGAWKGQTKASDPVGVVCKQLYPKIRTIQTSTTTPMRQTQTTPKPISRIKCHEPNTSLYSITSILGGICYFTLKNEEQSTNLKVGQDFQFSIDKARSNCKNHNATLPIVRNREEAQWILSQFKATAYHHKPKVSGVALGMTVQKKSAALKDRHLWDDQSKVTYVPEEWEILDSNQQGGISSVSYVFMHSFRRRSVNLDRPFEIAWKTVFLHNHTLSDPILVVCQQNMHDRVDPLVQIDQQLSKANYNKNNAIIFIVLAKAIMYFIF